MAVAAAEMGAKMDRNSSHPPPRTSVLMNFADLPSGLMTVFCCPLLCAVANLLRAASVCRALIGSPSGNVPWRAKYSSKWSFSVHLFRSHMLNAASFSMGISLIENLRQCMLTDFGGRPSKKDERRVKMS